MTGTEVCNKLVGAWRYVGTRIDGSNWDRGANPKGMIYYGPHGEMAVQIAPDIKRTRRRGDDAARSVHRGQGLHCLFRYLYGGRSGRHRHASSARQPAA